MRLVDDIAPVNSVFAGSGTFVERSDRNPQNYDPSFDSNEGQTGRASGEQRFDH
jgi:hypothetical protein